MSIDSSQKYVVYTNLSLLSCKKNKILKLRYKYKTAHFVALLFE